MPGFLMRDRIVVRRYNGSGAYGDTYSDPETVKARVEPTTKVHVGEQGQQEQATATVYVRPETAPIPPESTIMWAGREYRVMESADQPDAVRPSHRELVIG
jgi:hypothetical protein